MQFEKLKVGVHAVRGRCLVHLIYGSARDGNIEERILSSLEKAGIKTKSFYQSLPSEEDIAACLGRGGSMCYRLENVAYSTKEGQAQDGHSISFYTTKKDLAKAAITQLEKDGFKFKSVNHLKIKIDNTFDEANKRGVA